MGSEHDRAPLRPVDGNIILLLSGQETMKQERPNLKEIFTLFEGCVIFIETEKDGRFGNGTGFHIGDGLIVTAKHVAEVMSRLLYKVETGQDVEIVLLKTHLHSRADVAIIETNFVDIQETRGVVCEQNPDEYKFPPIDRIPLLGVERMFKIFLPELLSRTLVIGYPPVEYSQPALVTETGEINAIIGRGGTGESSKIHPMFALSGEVSAITEDYKREDRSFIISNLPRGGFSGGPVISEYGMLMGLAANSRVDINCALERGFFCAVSTGPIYELLKEAGLKFPGVTDELMAIFA